MTQAEPTTITSYHAALDHFYNYHLDLDLGRRPRTPPGAPRALEPPERKKFLRAAGRCDFTCDTAIALVLYFSGLRISELAALDTGDVVRSARRCKLIVRDGKGGVYRTVPGLHLLARAALEAWLTDRAAWLPPGSAGQAVFLGRRGDRRLRDIVGHIAADGGLSAGEVRGHHARRLELAGANSQVRLRRAGHRDHADRFPAQRRCEKRSRCRRGRAGCAPCAGRTGSARSLRPATTGT
ncbi:tyrosine-type recombinase/integrase [Amycolatopsis sp. PS_44_ISF1]|nr:tyrosine-type recombinase/integrase [Amycolatopsis sp. PS_44_ISF1]MDT8912235.1 tyrosine-type recombinase/integrase [Amycolatopsis sp. PS_44_ISF1]